MPTRRKYSWIVDERKNNPGPEKTRHPQKELLPPKTKKTKKKKTKQNKLRTDNVFTNPNRKEKKSVIRLDSEGCFPNNRKDVTKEIVELEVKSRRKNLAKI